MEDALNKYIKKYKFGNPYETGAVVLRIDITAGIPDRFRFDAETDRVIKKWCKINKIHEKKYKLQFVDYLKSAKLGEKIKYWLLFNKDNPFLNERRKWVRFVNHFLPK